MLAVPDSIVNLPNPSQPLLFAQSEDGGFHDPSHDSLACTTFTVDQLYCWPVIIIAALGVYFSWVWCLLLIIAMLVLAREVRLPTIRMMLAAVHLLILFSAKIRLVLLTHSSGNV